MTGSFDDTPFRVWCIVRDPAGGPLFTILLHHALSEIKRCSSLKDSSSVERSTGEFISILVLVLFCPQCCHSLRLRGDVRIMVSTYHLMFLRGKAFGFLGHLINIDGSLSLFSGRCMVVVLVDLQLSRGLIWRLREGGENIHLDIEFPQT